MIERPAWMSDALCAQVGGDFWYPPKGGTTMGEQSVSRLARFICARCTVRAACLAYALEHDEQEGIWGGLPPRARRRLSRGYVGPTAWDDIDHDPEPEDETDTEECA